MATASKTLNVEGMSCMHCVHAVKNAIASLPGINQVNVDLEAKKVSVEYEASQVKVEQIKAKIEDAGYEPV